MARYREQRGLAALSTRLVTACRILNHQRLVAAFGHVSARVPGSDRALISPRIGPGRATRKALLVVDPAGRVLRGTSRPPLELPIHTAIYRARPDVGAICRIHAFGLCMPARFPGRDSGALEQRPGGLLAGGLVTDAFSRDLHPSAPLPHPR